MGNITQAYQTNPTPGIFNSILSILLNPRLWVTICIAYPVLVHLLRHRRAHQLNKIYSTYLPPNLSHMTFTDAQIIVRHLAQLEFPFTFEKSLQFALFRTYGIPSISSLLLKTSLFSSPQTASKRYADTAVLIADFLDGTWGAPRWRESLARINCIHAPYVANNTISNEDMLYTLSLFACELPKWCRRFEWRELTTLELCALGVNWKGVGDAMQISFAALPSTEGGWRDGTHWLAEVDAWAQAYEARCMVPAESNKSVAEQTTAILLWTVPETLKPTARHVVYSLMDPRLRTAMLYPDPSPTIEKIVLGAFQIRRFVLRYLAPPRLRPWRSVSARKSAHGTYYLLNYDSLPYYVRPTLWNRWLSPSALLWRLRGLPVPGDEGGKYHPEGYSAVTAGPNHGKGSQGRAEKTLEPIGEMRCPMAFGR